MSQAPPLLLRGGRVVDPSQNRDGPADVLIADGKIAKVELDQAAPAGGAVVEAAGKIVSPGFVDLHCHLREPGEEDKETIRTGAQAALRGGFTTVCCMPNTKPAIDSRPVVEHVLEVAAAAKGARVLPIAAITRGRQGKELTDMGELAAAGVVGFSDDGSPVTNSLLMRHALQYSSMFRRPVISHCEDLELTQGGVMNEGAISTVLGLKGIPAQAEEIMVARDLALARLTGGYLHLAHISTAGSVDLIRRAKDQGLNVTAEATPHHLLLAEDMVAGTPAGFPWAGLNGLTAPRLYDTNTKVNPPLRSEADLRALREGLREGVIDAIATDHAPHMLTDKECEFGYAAFGISGLETALGVLLGLVERNEIGWSVLIEKLSCAPARIAGLGTSTLQAGSPADVTILDPNREWVVDPSQLVSLGKNTPLAGYILKGKVTMTIVGGEIRWQEEQS